jgi:hypothetical protein
MRRSAKNSIVPALVSLAFLSAPAAAQSNTSQAESEAADDVATQIREQGYDCKNPTNVKRDQKASEPDETAWILTCKNASYRVRLVPDMAAEVEKIE